MKMTFKSLEIKNIIFLGVTISFLVFAILIRTNVIGPGLINPNLTLIIPSRTTIIGININTPIPLGTSVGVPLYANSTPAVISTVVDITKNLSTNNKNGVIVLLANGSLVEYLIPANYDGDIRSYLGLKEGDVIENIFPLVSLFSGPVRKQVSITASINPTSITLSPNSTSTPTQIIAAMGYPPPTTPTPTSTNHPYP